MLRQVGLLREEGVLRGRTARRLRRTGQELRGGWRQAAHLRDEVLLRSGQPVPHVGVDAMAGGQGRFDGLADGKGRAPRRSRVQQATGTLGVPRSVQKALQEQPSRTESRPQGNAGQLRFDFLGRSAARPGIQGRPAGRGEARASDPVRTWQGERDRGAAAPPRGGQRSAPRTPCEHRPTDPCRVRHTRWRRCAWCWPSRIRHSR